MLYSRYVQALQLKGSFAFAIAPILTGYVAGTKESERGLVSSVSKGITQGIEAGLATCGDVAYATSGVMYVIALFNPFAHVVDEISRHGLEFEVLNHWQIRVKKGREAYIHDVPGVRQSFKFEASKNSGHCMPDTHMTKSSRSCPTYVLGCKWQMCAKTVITALW